VASEYSVNIRLNTAQVKKDLKTIGTEISNLGKKETKSSKTALSTTDKKLKVETQIATLQKRTQAIRNSILRLDLSGVKVSKIKSKLTRADNQADAKKFDLSKKNIALALKELEILKEQTIEIGKQTKVRGGNTFKFPMGPSSPLNFGPGGQLLPGSGRGMFGTTRGFDFQSALISGGFPLLFGQGPITAAAGAVGGGVGGMFGQMGGFAGGIAATAAVQSISSALNAVSELGRALSKPTENIQTLVDKLGLANTPTGDLALKLEKLGLTSSAASVLIEKFAEDFGRTPLEIEKMTKELDTFNQEMAKFGLRLQFIVADVFGPMVTLINKLPLGTIAKFFTARGFDFLNPGGATMPNVMTLPQKKLKAERKRGSGIQNNLPSTLQDVSAVADQLTFNREIKPLKQALEIEKLRLTTSSEKLNIMKEEFELENLTNELKIAQAENEKVSTDKLTTKISKLTAQVDLQKQVVANAKALEDPFRKLSNIISIDIGNGIKGLIRGTSTLGDLLSNVLNKLSDAFLNLAIFGNFGGGSVTGGLLGAIGFANGGRPPVGRPSVVGERGPELFVPDRAGTIVPNHQLAGMGGTNIVVNVDASGSNVQGDEAESRELGRLISVAVQSELVKQKRPGGILA
jgi:hypothetical protein